ncbi:hypothetical protein [Streptomyces sp. NRRL B-1347]|uniref:hypothetical protein n=1 Tax=Streptomyces sp. NRRL B-1347 TaxID=1476877 RepID=UPI000AE86403|nr:hypothetical protein [Streptomyces sp. NRRL B-1347]
MQPATCGELQRERTYDMRYRGSERAPHAPRAPHDMPANVQACPDRSGMEKRGPRGRL